MAVLVKGHAINAMQRALQRLGFQLVERSETGSRYFRLPGLQFKLRISDHRWPHQYRHPSIVHSEIVQPFEETDARGLALEAGIRFIFKARMRLGLVRSVAA